MPAPLSVAAVLLLAAALGLYYVAAATVWVALVRQARWAVRPLAASVLFAALWLLAELLRGRWFTGFPWGAGGYAHVDGWLAAAAPWVGVYGMGAIAAFVSMRLALLRAVPGWMPQRRWRAVLLLALLLGGVAQLPGADRFTQSARIYGREHQQPGRQDYRFASGRRLFQGMPHHLQGYCHREERIQGEAEDYIPYPHQLSRT